MESKRIEAIDIAKGFGIFLVVIGHFINMSSYPGRVIYSFHMPLFFFLSGICFNDKKYATLQELFGNRARTLLWPCFCFTITISLFQSVLISIPLCSLRQELPGALWFLPILFVAEIFYFYLCKIKKNYRLMILLTTYCVGVAFHEELQGLPYKISFIPKALLYYGLGHILRDKTLCYLRKFFLISKAQRYSSLFLLISVVLVSAAFCLNEANLLVGMLKVAVALCGIIATLMFCSISFPALLKESILFLGQNTLVIMAVHVFFMRCSLYYLEPIVDSYVLYKIIEFIFVWSTSLLCVCIVNRYASWIKRI